MNKIELRGLDGTNPLGYMAALGALMTLHGGGEGGARLCWARRSTWVAVLDNVSETDPEGLSEIVARGLRGREVPPEAERERAQTVKRFEAAKKAVSDKRKELRKRGLRGADRQAALEAELNPLEHELLRARDEWLKALAAAVPRPELALGKRLDCTPEEYRRHAETLVAGSAAANRDALDLLAAFGTDACINKKLGAINPTPFQFITGSGHQFFLGTARQLMAEVTAEAIRRTLFEAWTYPDEGLSMRWDPSEDRRYALMDRDPTAAGNKPRTMWMANLLGYRALALFPAVPRRGRLRVVGWTEHGDEPVFTWPLWKFPASLDMVGSLLALRELSATRPDRAVLHSRGVAAVFRSRRIKVGSGANFKLNFSPARGV